MRTPLSREEGDEGGQIKFGRLIGWAGVSLGRSILSASTPYQVQANQLRLKREERAGRLIRLQTTSAVVVG